jgi:Fe-S-cluster containining protein
MHRFEINFNLAEKDFRLQIEEMIKNARMNETVLSLPSSKADPLEYTALFLSQINCTNCESLCCKSKSYAKYGIPFANSEYQSLENRVGKERLEKLGIKTIGKTKFAKVPCPFLHKKQCTIYDIRPHVCMQYPIDVNSVDSNGIRMFSVDPFCPEARRIVKQVWMIYWKLFNKLKEMSTQINDIKETAAQELKLED